MRIIGLDYGKRRIGVALSDGMGLIASPMCVIDEPNFRVQLSKVAAEVEKSNAQLIVMGLPKNMDNTEGESAQLVREFGQKLQELSGVEVKYLDERLTTVIAHKSLNQMNVNGSHKRKGIVDTLSATIILQNYLDTNK